MGVISTRVVKFIRKGVGIAYIDVEYADSTSNSVAPTTGWQTNAPAWQNGHYIWTRTHIVYTDGTDQYSNPVCIPSGKGIASIVEQYYQSTSATELVGGQWIDNTAPAWVSGKYIWTRSKITYTDGTVQYTDAINPTGQKGDTGNGISSIVEYYLAYASDTGVTTSTSGWTTTVQALTATERYLWNYEKITYTDGTVVNSTPHVIGTYGKGIKSVTDYYLATSANNGVTTSTSGWTTTVQTMTATNKYLWNYEVITYDDDTTKTIAPHIIGAYGDKGDTGNGISSIVEYYLAHTSDTGVTTSTSGWTTTVQALTATERYLWNYEKITYTDGTVVNSTPHVIGTYGKGIKSVTDYYLATSANNGVTTSTSGWTTTVQTMTATNKYLWNYEVITYDDETTKTIAPHIIGAYGDIGPQGPQGNDGITYEIACTVGNVTIPADVDTALLNCTAAFYKREGTAARTAKMCYYSVYSRIGTTYALLSMQSGYNNNGYDDGVAIRGTVYTGYDAVVVFMFTGNYRDTNPAGQAYLAKCEIIVKKQGNTGPQGEQGPQGPQGPEGGTGSQGPRGYRGPALRGPQDWAQMDTDYQFYEGADGEPYEDFVIKDGTYYKCIKTHTKTLTNAPGSTYDTNNHLWQQTTKVGIVAANILFGNHGYFGSAIISGDWMISTNGTINGTEYNNGATYNGIIAYSLFNPNRPLGGDIIKYTSVH